MLKGWLIKSVKTPILTILKQPDEKFDFIDTGALFENVKRSRFLNLRIRINTIFTNLLVNANPKNFPQPLMTFMNSFMIEGGYVPYEFFTEFETDIFEFDSSDALMNFKPKNKALFAGSFIIS